MCERAMHAGLRAALKFVNLGQMSLSKMKMGVPQTRNVAFVQLSPAVQRNMEEPDRIKFPCCHSMA